MLVACLVLLALPQEPPQEPAEEYLRKDAWPKVEALLKATASPPPTARNLALAPPALMAELRRAGLGVLKRAESALDLEARKVGAKDLLDLAARLYGFKPGKLVPPRLNNLKALEQFFVQNYRRMRKALVIRGDLASRSPRLHALMERLHQAGSGRRLLAEDRKLIQKELRQVRRIDLAAMWRAAMEVLQVAEALRTPKLKDRLGRLPARKSQAGVLGAVLLDQETPYGRLVIGGPGRNEYRCGLIDVLIDLGGDDVYTGPAGGAGEARRYAVCIDLSGNDHYKCLNDALGSATYGLAVFVDWEGDDVYEAGRRSAGFAVAGVAVFLEGRGKDRMQLSAHSAGVGLFGLGLFADLEGNDEQTAGGIAFGCGLPGGLGLFVDSRGSDRRQQLESGAPEDWGMGAGIGLPDFLPGGLGVCLDLAGDDIVSAGSMVLGCGEYGGIGLFRDRGGDDSYSSGSMSCGVGDRGGLGLFLEDQGNDRYVTGELSLGVARNGSRAFFWDRRGGDDYRVRVCGMGLAYEKSLALFVDLGGKDRFAWQRAGEKAYEMPGLRGPSLGFFGSFGGESDTYRRQSPLVFKKLEGNDHGMSSGDPKDPASALQIFVDR